MRPTDVLHYIWRNTYLCEFFTTCVNEDEELSLLRPIRRWRQFEMEVLKWVMFLKPALMQTDCSAVVHIRTGRKCTSRWCMAQILIWIDDPRLKQFPADRWASRPRAQILAQQRSAQIHQPFLRFCQGPPHYLFLLLPLPVDWGWGSAWYRCCNLFRLLKKKKKAKYTTASCILIIISGAFLLYVLEAMVHQQHTAVLDFLT